jgi:hypothetical protein
MMFEPERYIEEQSEEHQSEWLEARESHWYLPSVNRGRTLAERSKDKITKEGYRNIFRLAQAEAVFWEGKSAELLDEVAELKLKLAKITKLTQE